MCHRHSQQSFIWNSIFGIYCSIPNACLGVSGQREPPSEQLVQRCNEPDFKKGRRHPHSGGQVVRFPFPREETGLLVIGHRPDAASLGGSGRTTYL